MRRLLSFGLLWSCLLLVPLGCRKEQPKTETATSTLTLILPDSVTPAKDRPERHSKLIVNGKDFSEPRGAKRTLTVDIPANGSAEAKIEFTFWPNSYTEITRTKVVKLEKDKTVEVSLLKVDPDSPDHIKPLFIPTSMEVTEQMCKFAKIGPGDVVYDIGCGDGRMVIMAVEKFGAKKGVGIDIREELIPQCIENAKKAGVADKVEFRAGDALKIKDYSEASVVLIYLGDFLNEALKPDLKASLKPGSRVVSHRFLMGKDWPPDVSDPIVTTEQTSSEAGHSLHRWNIK